MPDSYDVKGIGIELVTKGVNEARAQLNGLLKDARVSTQAFKNLDNAAKVNPENLQLAQNALEALNQKVIANRNVMASANNVYRLQADNVKKAKEALEAIADTYGKDSEEYKKAENSLRMFQNGLEQTSRKLPVYKTQLALAEQELLKYTETLNEKSNLQSKEYIALEKATKEYEDEKKALASVSKEVANYKSAIKNAEDTYSATETYLEALNKQYDQQQKVIGSLSVKVDALKNVFGPLSQEVKEAEQELSVENSELARLRGLCDQAESQLIQLARGEDEVADNAEEAVQQVNAWTVALGNLIAQGIRMAISELEQLGTEVIETGKDFEEGMSGLASIYQIDNTSKEINLLSDRFRDLAKNTRYSATELASNAQVLANAGYNVQQTEAAIESISNLAQGTGEEFEEMANVVVDGLHAFNMSASESEHFANALATAAVNSNTNVSMMGDAFKYAGTVAGSFGYTIEDTAMALGIFASNGIKGTQAGTALRTIITRLAANTSHARDKFEELGGKFYDAEGSALPLRDVLISLREGMADLSDEEKATAAYTIAGQRGLTALNAVVNMSTDEFNALANAIDDSNGAVAQMATTRLDTFAGSVDLLANRFDELKLTAYDRLEPALKKTADRLAETLDDPKVEANVKQLADSFNGLVDTVGDVAETLAPHSKTIVTALEGIAGGYLAIKVLDGAATIGTAISNAMIAISTGAGIANPALLAFQVAAAGVAGVATLLKIAMDESNASFDAAHPEYVQLKEDIEDIANTNDSIRNSMKKTEEAYEDSFDSAQRNAKRAGYLADRLDDLQKAADGSAASYRLNADAITELNELYPELNLSIDKQGKLIGTTVEEIHNQIGAFKELAVASAYQEKIKDLQSEYVDAMVNSAMATEELRVAREELERYEGKTSMPSEYDMFDDSSLSYGTTEYNKYAEAVENATIAQENANKTEEQIKATLDATTASYESYSRNLDASTQAIANNTAVLTENGAITTEVLGIETSQFQDWNATLTDTLEKAKTNWFKYEAAEKQSLATMQKNLDQNVKQIKEWETNLAKLAESGADSTLMDYLIKLGTDGAGYVAALADAASNSKKDWEKFKDSWQDAMSIDEFSSKILKDAEKAGGSIAKGVADGEESNAKLPTEAAKIMMDGTYKAIDDDGKEAQRAGWNIVRGLANGIYNNTAIATGAAQALANKVNSIMKAALDIHSPSRITYGYGEYYVEGFANSVDDNTSMAVDSVQNLAKSVNRAFDSAIETPQFKMPDVDAFVSSAGSAFETSGKVEYEMGNRTISAIINSNNAVVDAINSLAPILATAGGDTYNIGDINTGDDTTVSSAVKALTGAIRRSRNL